MKEMLGKLTQKMGGVFYGMCLLIDDNHITEDKIEKAAATRSKHYEDRE